MANEQLTEYSFTLTKIELLEKKLESFERSDEEKPDYTFDISLEIGHNPVRKECVYKMRVEISDKNNNQLAGLLSLACIFFIPKYDEYVSASSNQNPFPQGLLFLLNTVVIGTMRGLMFAEFRGTPLQDAYLPVLDPRKFQEVD